MKMVKKTLAVVLVMATLLLTGCGVVQNEPAAQPSEDKATEAVGGVSQPLEGAEITLRLSHADNAISLLENTWNCYAETFKSNLETFSGGTMTVEIFPNSQLGDETSCIEQCSKGTIDMVVGFTCGNLASWVPNFNVFDVPYLIGNLDVANLVCQGPLMDELNADLEAAGNMRVLGLMCTAFRNLDTWDKPVHTVEDMAGKKMRVMSIEAHTRMVDAWGAIPTSVSFSELYSAASTGVIDCYENGNYTLFMNNLYETVDYVTETQHIANACTSVISSKTYNGLTEEQQGWVDSAAAEARRAALGVVTANNVNITSKLQENGIEVISLSEEAKAGFKDACYDHCLEYVLGTIEPEFYQAFLDAYEEAEAMLRY